MNRGGFAHVRRPCYCLNAIRQDHRAQADRRPALLSNISPFAAEARRRFFILFELSVTPLPECIESESGSLHFPGAPPISAAKKKTEPSKYLTEL
jgi:hypothetical protein